MRLQRSWTYRYARCINGSILAVDVLVKQSHAVGTFCDGSKDGRRVGRCGGEVGFGSQYYPLEGCLVVWLVVILS